MGDAPAGWTELSSRVPAFLSRHLLTAGLAGDGKLCSWRLFMSPDATALCARAELGGGALCGHPGVAHGGLLAALIDDACGALFIAGGRSGYTAALNVNYKAPVMLSDSGSTTTLVVDVTLEREEASASRPGAKKVFFAATVRGGSTVHTTASVLFVTKAVPGSFNAAAAAAPQ